jgi:hypothetical protein
VIFAADPVDEVLVDCSILRSAHRLLEPERHLRDDDPVFFRPFDPDSAHW